MFANQLNAALAQASLKQTDEICRTLWRAFAAGSISEEQAAEMSSSVELRRIAIRAPNSEKTLSVEHGTAEKRPPLPRYLFPVRKSQRSHNRPRSIARRRILATSGALPPKLAALFTTGEIAVLTILAGECGNDGNGACDASIGEIAARSGVCRTIVQNAVRIARDHGLIDVTERRRSRRPSLTNIIRIISTEWKVWIKHRKFQKTVTNKGVSLNKRGFKKIDRTGKPTVKIKGRPRKNVSFDPKGQPTAVA